MKIGYRVLEQSTVVWADRTSINKPDYNIPTEPVPSWHPTILRPDAVVLLLDSRPPSPVTGQADEHYIQWLDAAGRVNTGWIAQTTRMHNTVRSRLSLGQPDPRLPMSAWDQMRWRAGWPVKFKTPAVKQWLFTYGREYVALLRAVVREWGGHYKKDDDAVTLIRQIVGQVFHETLGRVPNMASMTKKGPLSGREALAALKGKSKKSSSDLIDLRDAKKPRSKKEAKAQEKKAAQKAAKKAKPDKPSKKEKKGKAKKAAGKPVNEKAIVRAFKDWKNGESLSSLQNRVGRSLTGPFIKLAGSKEAFFKLRKKGAGGRRFE